MMKTVSSTVNPNLKTQLGLKILVRKLFQYNFNQEWKMVSEWLVKLNNSTYIE